MPAHAGLLAALAFATFAGHAAVAQDSPASVIVIDQERLFQESLFGQKITSELEERSAALAAENRAIEAQLIAEERDLTERRAELEPKEFRTLANAFDEKVDRLRSEQDAKTGELVAIRDAGRQNFTQSVGPILLDFMRQSGASVMLDRRSVVVTADRVDATDELIAEIDERVGAGDFSVEPPDSLPDEGQPDNAVVPPAPATEEPLSMPNLGDPQPAPTVGEPPLVPEAAE